MLDTSNWDDVELSKIASIHSGKDIYAQERIPGNMPYITAGSVRNGIGYFVSNNNASKTAKAISVNRNGAVGEAFYHPYTALYGNDCRRVNLKESSEDDTMFFLAQCISAQKSAFGYGRKLGTARLKRLRVMLPIDASGNPDYAYMEQYASEKRGGLRMRYRQYLSGQLSQLEYKEIPALKDKEWKRFKAFGKEGLFEIATTGSSIDGIRLIDGEIKRLPYVTRTAENNGIGKFVSDDNLAYGSDEAGCITVGLDTQTAFWQPHLFVTGQNIQIITGKHLNKWFAQFIIPLFRSQMTAKFNWGGNGATLKRMKTLELMLPIDSSGEPDYAYMEQYAKNMMLRKYKQYLAFLDMQENEEND